MPRRFKTINYKISNYTTVALEKCHIMFFLILTQVHNIENFKFSSFLFPLGNFDVLVIIGKMCSGNGYTIIYAKFEKMFYWRFTIVVPTVSKLMSGGRG